MQTLGEIEMSPLWRIFATAQPWAGINEAWIKSIYSTVLSRWLRSDDRLVAYRREPGWHNYGHGDPPLPSWFISKQIKEYWEDTGTQFEYGRMLGSDGDRTSKRRDALSEEQYFAHATQDDNYNTKIQPIGLQLRLKRQGQREESS